MFDKEISARAKFQCAGNLIIFFRIKSKTIKFLNFAKMAIWKAKLLCVKSVLLVKSRYKISIFHSDISKSTFVQMLIGSTSSRFSEKLKMLVKNQTTDHFVRRSCGYSTIRTQRIKLSTFLYQIYG